jgi:hypothetical protein
MADSSCSRCHAADAFSARSRRARSSASATSAAPESVVLDRLGSVAPFTLIFGPSPGMNKTPHLICRRGAAARKLTPFAGRVPRGHFSGGADTKDMWRRWMSSSWSLRRDYEGLLRHLNCVLHQSEQMSSGVALQASADLGI